MAAICPGARLLVDSTYREAAFGDDPVASSYLELGGAILSCASLSKCHGAPGLRVGWAITTDRALREELIVAKFNTVVSGSPVDEFLAVKLLEQREPILRERRRRLGEGVAMVGRWVAEHDELVEWVRPDAGALCCVRLRRAAFDGAAVARFHELLSAAGVRVGRGPWFGEEDRVLRLGFGLLPPADLEAALARVATALGGAAGRPGVSARRSST
jgi:aspartate/methionine/tyrosine aminotransferase